MCAYCTHLDYARATGIFLGKVSRIVKLIAVQCRRPNDDTDDESLIGLTFATDGAHAEQLCRDAFADFGYTRFEAQESLEGPFENLQPQVFGYGGRSTMKELVQELRRWPMRISF